MTQDYFRVKLSDAIRLALPLASVETVLQINPQQVCPIPGLPAYWMGTVNRRGALMWVLDLGRFLQLGQAKVRPGKNLTTVVLMARLQTTTGGLEQRSIACVVSELEGVFAPTQVRAFTKPLKPHLKSLLEEIASYAPNGSAAVLKPTALFQSLRAETAAALSQGGI